MKLSEVIKAIEDGKIDRAKSGLVHFERFGNYTTFYYNGMSLFSIGINQQFEDVKPPRQWSEKELMLFKLLPDWAKWISIDNDGSVWVFEEKPYLDSDKSYDAYSGNMDVLCDIFGKIITITFEESPIYIGDLEGE